MSEQPAKRSELDAQQKVPDRLIRGMKYLLVISGVLVLVVGIYLRWPSFYVAMMTGIALIILGVVVIAIDNFAVGSKEADAARINRDNTKGTSLEEARRILGIEDKKGKKGK